LKGSNPMIAAAKRSTNKCRLVLYFKKRKEKESQLPPSIEWRMRRMGCKKKNVIPVSSLWDLFDPRQSPRQIDFVFVVRVQLS